MRNWIASVYRILKANAYPTSQRTSAAAYPTTDGLPPCFDGVMPSLAGLHRWFLGLSNTPLPQNFL